MLNEYQKKRDFKHTGEPPPLKKKGTGDLTFVIQKHAARRLHYDFRLELDGVLKSWAVPNGPSLDSKVKRLAVEVEDHPLEYASFEGNIPTGEYGAGQVLIWDRGVYSPDKDGQLFFGDRDEAQKTMRENLKTGQIKVFLRGNKLNGSFALVKMRQGRKNWLLIKHKDEFATYDEDILKKDISVSSGRSMEEIKNGADRLTRKIRAEFKNVPGLRKAVFPTSLNPMLATAIRKPFSDPDWLFEPKLDGFRILTFIKNGQVKLLSRNGIDVTKRYKLIADGLSKQAVEEAILDGEVIALDENGRSCFQCLQDHLYGEKKGDSGQYPVIYYIFDILYLDGYDLCAVPLFERKRFLEIIISQSKYIHLIDFVEKDGNLLYEASIKSGMEGVVAKKIRSIYEPGLRSGNWLKIKSEISDEFVIGGYTKGLGSRSSTFGALLLGNYNDNGDLIFAGHVGTGFDEKLLTTLKPRLDSIAIEQSPFAENPILNTPPTWVRPELVAEVKFVERTQDGLLRTPVFIRLREDKTPAEAGHGELVNKDSFSNLSQSASEVSGGSHENIVEQLANPEKNFSLKAGGFQIKLSNLDKPLWPAIRAQRAITKRDLLIYFDLVSPYILRHLHNRPLTLTRYPNGIAGKYFFQKHFNSPIPGFLGTVSLSEHKGAKQNYLLCNNLSSLLWLGQMANIDIHTWFSRIDSEPSLKEDAGSKKGSDFFADFPDFIIFDLDPYIYSGDEIEGAEPELNRSAFQKTCEVALKIKEILDSLTLHSFIKTSGRTGLHIYVPIMRQFDYHSVHSAAKTICEFVLKKYPQDVTLDWAVDRRTGKIFLDYNQNMRGKTLASIYSPRSSPLATVSTPLRWEEVGKAYPTDFTILTVPERLAEIGDLWKTILDSRSDLKYLLGLERDGLG